MVHPRQKPKLWTLLKALSFALLLLGCSDLNVFITNTRSSDDFSGLESVTVNSNGQFELAWQLGSKKGKTDNDYEIYLYKTIEAPKGAEQLNLTQDNLLSTFEVPSLASDKSPVDIKLVATVTNSDRYTYDQEIIDPGAYYIFEVRSKSTRHLKQKKPKIILSKINFGDISTVAMAVTRSSLTVSWAAVNGATSYQIFDNPNSIVPQFTTTENSIALSYLQASDKKSYCLRAVRGTLRSKSCLHLEGIGTSLKPWITHVSTALNAGFYKDGDVLTFDVKFTDTVRVTNSGGLRLPLLFNDGTRYAYYTHGDGTDTLGFTYTVRDGDNTPELKFLTRLEMGPGGTVSDTQDRPANLDFASFENPLGKDLVVDTIMPDNPQSVGFTSGRNQALSVAMAWTGGGDANLDHFNAKLCELSGCTTNCTAAVTSTTKSASAVGVNGKTYFACVQAVDKVGQTTAWVSSIQNLTIDTSAPTISQITSVSPNGSFKVGAIIPLKVEFSENIFTVRPEGISLLINAGSSNRQALYASGAGPSSLLFNYTVQPGDTSSDLDYASAGALLVGADSFIRDFAENAAVLTLPTPGSPNSLSAQRDFIIDTTLPAPAFLFPAASTPGQGSLAIALSCETGNAVSITGNLTTSLNGLICASNSLARTVFFASGEGNKTVTLTETDRAGNVGTSSRIFVNDNVASILTQTTTAPTTYSAGNSLTIGGACESNLDVVIKLLGVEEGRVTCNGGAWSYITASKSSDATRVYGLSQADAAGNTATASVTWLRDTVTPTFTFDDFSAAFAVDASNNAYTFRGYCDSSASVTNPSIVITGPGITGSASVSCILGAWTYLTPTRTNGMHIYTFVQTDRASNATTIFGTWTRNTAGPALSSPTVLLKSSLNQVSFAGLCDASYTIAVSGPNSPTPPSCNAGTWSFTTPTITSDGNSVFVLTQTNMSGDSTNLSLTFLRDSTAPVVSTMSVNQGDSSTLSYRTLIGLTAADATTPINSICILQRVWVNSSTAPTAPVAPNANDVCWQTLSSVGMSSSKSVTVTGMPFVLSLASGKYSTYAFVRDEVGNISANANTEGIGRATITLTVPTPPTLSIVGVTNTTGSTQSEFAAGEEIDLHWNVTGGTGIGATPLGIRWSIDDSNWTSYIANLPNSANNCTPVVGATGCYRLTAPTSNYMRLQLVVQNSNNDSYYRESKALNTGNRVRQVAGRTFKGLGGNAKGFQLNFSNMENLFGYAANNFVVTRQGVIYVIDTALGILKIDPRDQIVTIAYPKAAYPGDGSLTNLKIPNPNRIWLDLAQPLQRLWINDGSVLRVLDFNTNTSKTYDSTAAAGASGTTNEVSEFFPTKSGLYAKVRVNLSGAWHRIPALINESTGKFDVFRLENAAPYLPAYSPPSNADCEDMIYHSHPIFAEDGSLSKWWSEYYWFDARCHGEHIYNMNSSTLTGTYGGTPGMPGNPVSMPGSLNHNWSLEVHMGLNGLIYMISRQGGAQAGAYMSNATATSWTKVLGQTNPSSPVNQLSCADGTVWSVCDIDINSIFVDEAGTIYFMDQGQIRIVDASGKVQTIFGSSFRKIASNLSATDTVIGDFVNYFQRRVDIANSKEEVVFSHFATKTYRSVMDDKINILAGNGLSWSWIAGGPSSGVAPGIIEGVWIASNNIPFALDEAGNLFVGDYESGQGATVFKLTRSSLLWSTYIPYSCAGCTGVASDLFDPAAGSFNSANKVKLNSSFQWAPSPISANNAFTQVRPIVHGMTGTKLIVQTAEPSIRYNGATDATWQNARWYSMNIMISAADTANHDGTTVTNFRRIVGAKGAVKLSANTDLGYSWIYFNGFPSSGTAANEFDLQSYQHGGKVPLTANFQEYDGAYYGVLTAVGPTKLLKVSNNLVTYTYTSLNIRNFTLVKSGSDDILYYCSTTGLLRKRNLTTTVESTVDLVIPGATCSGSQMIHYENAGFHYLMFVYTQNALNGIVELKITP
ncbi:MAG: hypothetical protein H7318_12035 [Oligoflexus sp.]|nr:hypothetical protein [Oligoflexus sp.]